MHSICWLCKQVGAHDVGLLSALHWHTEFTLTPEAVSPAWELLKEMAASLWRCAGAKV